MSTAYNFKDMDANRLGMLLATVFDLTSGHDHDGVNSKSVTVGTPDADSVGVDELEDDALPASADGRAKIATDYFTTATLLDQFVADSIDASVLLDLIADGAFAADADTRALFADAIWPPEKLTAIANTKIIHYEVEDLAAGADIASRILAFGPAGATMTLTNVSIVPRGSSAGVDDANTAVIELTDGTNTIVSKTYDTGTQPPADGAVGDLGALDATHKILAAGEKLTLNVTQGATANLPAFLVQIAYTLQTV